MSSLPDAFSFISLHPLGCVLVVPFSESSPKVWAATAGRMGSLGDSENNHLAFMLLYFGQREREREHTVI